MPHFVRDDDAQVVVKRVDRHVLECRTPVNNGPGVELEVCNDAGPAAPSYTVLDPHTSSTRTYASWLLSGKITRLFHSQGKNPEGRRGWKPITLRAPILASVTIFSLAIVLVLELLYSKCVERGDMNDGGVAFATDSNEVSVLTTFGFLYAPTILAVLYSILWSWVDLDTKRLEPWFQLSKHSGSIADESVLLQYPFDFLPFVPISALRRKHWAVSLAGTVMLLVFWVITPLQSSIFNSGTVTRSLPTDIATSAALKPISFQQTQLDANFMNLGYAISWLGQPFPPYTSADVALLPFQPISSTPYSSTTETWSTISDIYSTDLDCTPAYVEYKPVGYTFSNGRGCVVPDIALQAINEYLVLYIGYYSNAVLDWYLQGPDCTQEHSNNFLALFTTKSSALVDGSYANLTAIFCQPRYQINEAYVTVNALNGTIASSDLVLSQPRSASMGDIFNTSHFEYLLGVGLQPDTERADYPNTLILDQTPQLLARNISYPVTNVVGFAVALNDFPIPDLADPNLLRQSFARAHKLLFSAAISTLTTTLNTNDFENTRPGIRNHTSTAIIMVRKISIVVEAALALIIILTFSLWYISQHRPSCLVRDPASIMDIMSMLGNDGILGDLHYDEFLTSTTLSQSLMHTSFAIDFLKSDGKSNLRLKFKSSAAGSVIRVTSAPQTEKRNARSFTPIQPLEFRSSFGLAFVGVIILAAGIVLFLQVRSTMLNGLSLPSTNPIVLSLLENYVPAVFSTFLEPAWIILNRVLCLLLPFEELRKGNARPESSIDAKYTSLPPQLVIWRALRSGHYLLSAVCIVAVSMNVLAIALTSLIFEDSAEVRLAATSSQLLLPQLSGRSIEIEYSVGGFPYFPHFYISMSNLTKNTPLPPWVDRDYFYVPFEIPAFPPSAKSGTPLTLQGFQASTTGFGAELSCFELKMNENATNTVIFNPNKNGSIIYFKTSHQLTDTTQVTCVGLGINNPFSETDPISNEFTTGTSALETVNRMQAASGTNDEGFCSDLIVAGWVRADPEAFNPQETDTLKFDGQINATFIGCKPRLSAATFEVFVDNTGHILSSARRNTFTQNSAQNSTNSSTEALLMNANNLIIKPIDGYMSLFQWHNDSFTSDWINSLIEYTIHSNNFVNPQSNPPSSNNATAILQGVYSQLFAILLSLNSHVFSNSSEPINMNVTILAQEPRLFVSAPMFKVTITLLGLQVIVAILYYAFRPVPFLPRMPTSIASVVSYVSNGHMLGVVSPKAESATTHNKEIRYGYGRFLGTDGKTHLGIDLQRYVIQLQTRNSQFKSRKWNWASRKDDENESRTWI